MKKSQTTKRKGYQVVRPAAPPAPIPQWHRMGAGGTTDGQGRWIWIGFELGFLKSPPSLPNTLNEIFTGKGGSLTNGPVVNFIPGRTLSVTQVAFRTRYYDTGKTCWFSASILLAPLFTI